ncbi:MAG: TIGR01212 family radical SAM protein, partial [Thermoguttaceae bacterium]
MSELPFWRALGLRYYAQGPYFKREFGGVVRKISVDAHFSCPNIDGTVGSGGCVFCDARSFSPSRFFGLQDLDAQINDGILKITRRFDSSRFIAYFPPSTNT